MKPLDGDFNSAPMRDTPEHLLISLLAIPGGRKRFKF